jgi:hypothetical protein
MRDWRWATMRDDQPPFEAWMVYEVDIDRERETPLYVSSRGPFPTKAKAEQERDEQQEAWEKALAEWDDGSPYDFKGWQIERVLLRDFQLEKLQREDRERFELRREAAGAVAEGLISEVDRE